MGLTTLVGWSLYDTARQSLLRAELDARSRARDHAAALRLLVRDPSLLDSIDAHDRFELVDGRLAVPPQVGWLEVAPPRLLSAPAAERMRLAQLAEFACHDPAAARDHQDLALADASLDARDALAVRLAAAWTAHRSGDAVRVDELLAPVDAWLALGTRAQLQAPAQADLVAGRALLAAARGEQLPGACRTLLVALPDTLLTATLSRLRERGVEVAALTAEARELQRRRTTLRRAMTLVAELRAGATLARAQDHRLLLYHGDPSTGSGRGAWTEATCLEQLVGVRVPDVPGLVFSRPSTDAEVVVPDLAWVTPVPVPETPWFARPTALLAATLVLLLTFAGSVGLALRSVRQQAAAMRARSDFLTGVTHELKTPIASIRLVTEVLTEDEVPADRQRDYVSLLAGEAARLSMLIDNVLDLGQIERGERNYDLRAGDLGDVVRRTVGRFAPLAERAGLRVDLHQDEAPVPAVIDAGALSQALLAVLENARKYAARGSRLELHTATDSAHFVLRVRDHGPGVPAAEREAIFARFTRGAAQRHGSVPGVGLGLYLARTIVARHGGTLTCSSPEDGAGCVFTFRLPLQNPAP